MGDESVANHSAAPTSRKLELRHIYTVVQQWLDAQRASEWVLGQIQERWRALGDSRSPLTERLRDLSGKRAWNLAKLADFDKWNPLRQGRRKFGIAAWLLDFVAALHPEALLDVERTLALGETSPEVGIEDELSADLAAINHSLGGHELRVALVGRVVLRRRVRMNTPPMQESELLHDDVGAGGLKANEADATDELATHATALIGQIATIPVHDPFWDQLDAFVARIRDLARDVHRRREIDAEADRRRDLARQLLDTLSAVWATYEDVIHWLGLAQPSVPEAIELTAHSALAADIGALDEALRAFRELRETRATSEPHDRELYEARRGRADDVRAQIGAVAHALQAAAFAMADSHVAEPSAGSATTVPESPPLGDTPHAAAPPLKCLPSDTAPAAPTAAPAEVAPEIAPSHFDTATELAPEREFETGAAAVHAGEPLASPAPLEPIEATPPPGAPPSAHAPLPPAAPPVTASDASPPPAPRERQLSGTAASPTASVPPTVSTESGQVSFFV